MINILNNPWVIGIGVTVIGGLILYHFFGVGKSQKVIQQKGGHGGNAKASGGNSTAIGGKGGSSGPGGKGGDGGGVEGVGDNTFAMGGDGGEAGQTDRGGYGADAPLKVLQERNPDLAKEIMETFNISKEEAGNIGKGGDGGSPIQQTQKQKFEENKNNYLDPRNSNK